MEKQTPPNKSSLSRPPLYTLLVDVVGWTMDRTADIPKSQRFTFGQRLDNLALDALQSVTKAIFTGDARQKQVFLGDLLLQLEQMLVLWRLGHSRRWLSQQQLLFVSQRLDEAGRMANGWRQQQAGRSATQPASAKPPPQSKGVGTFKITSESAQTGQNAGTTKSSNSLKPE